MPKNERIKTPYPGVFFVMGKASNGRPEKIYYIIYRRGGKLIEEKVGRQYKNDMTPARASAERTKRIEGAPSNQERREEAEKTKWTVDRLWQEYGAHRPTSKAWLTDQGRYKNFLQAGLGSKEPKDIVQLDLDRLRITLSKTKKPQTVKHVLVLLQRIINFGVKKGLCPGLGFKIEMPRVHNLKTEDLSPEQLSNLMEAISQDHDIQAGNFMRMALFTGMRRGELFKLKWEDIDFDRGFIHIRQPKGGKDQTIPLNQAARDLLEDHPRDIESPYVFPGRGGRQRTRSPKRIDIIREKANLPKDFRPLHGLRHTYASMLASSGQVDLYTLQKLLTHKSPVMTQRYAHLRDETLRRASDLAGDLIGQTVNGKRPQVINGGKKE
ncbi:MAG: site-specific integrase [Desulfobaccales bacterium]|jgi:integrase